MRTLVGGAALLALTLSVAVGQEKIDAAKLVGKWTLKDPKKGPEMKVDFLKDGKVALFLNLEGIPATYDGTYKVDGDKIELAIKFDALERKDTLTVKRLTDTELETTDARGKSDVFVRIADKAKDRKDDKPKDKKDEKKEEKKDEKPKEKAKDEKKEKKDDKM